MLLLAKNEIQKHTGKPSRKETASQTAKQLHISQRNVSAPSSSSKSRKKISIHIKRELMKKAQEQCQYQNPISQKRCTAKHFLQTEHAWPLALGGTNEPENLRIYCSAHNRLAAEEMGVDWLKE